MFVKLMSTVVTLAVAVPLAFAVPAAAAPPAPAGPLHPGLPTSRSPIGSAGADAARGLPATAPQGGDLRALLDAWVAEGATAALAEVREPAGTWRGASGVSRVGQPGRVAPDGRFRAGSVTKTFVATVVLQLAAERRLRLDDPVERWLPGQLRNGGQITLRHLLTHTSGLYEYSDDLIESIQVWLPNRYRTWRPAELVAAADRHDPLFAPGAQWSYSNTNYVLLGMVVRAVTGRGYAVEIRDRIIRPLHLRQTWSPGASPDIAGPHAHVYLAPQDTGLPTRLDVTRINPTIAGASGDLVSSAADLNTFFRALLTGRLLPPAQLAEMKSPVSPGGYGMGLESTTLPCGVTVYGHGGGIFNYATLSFHTADARRQVTASINAFTGNLDPTAIALLDRVFCPKG